MDKSVCMDKFFEKLKKFCEINEQFSIAFKLTEKNGKLTRKEKNDLHLHYIACNIITVSSYFHDVVNYFSEYLTKILSISLPLNQPISVAEQHKKNCVLLGKIVHIRPSLQWYAMKYFKLNQSPFNDEKQSLKKSKLHHVLVSDLDLIESCYFLLKSNPSFYASKWDWADFCKKYLNHKDEEVQWLACHCLAIVTQMSEHQLKDLILQKIPIETHEKLSCFYHVNATLQSPESIITILDQQPCISINKNAEATVVDICGVFIPKAAPETSLDNKLVVVDSTENNLKKIALGLASNKAICLQGPVGSGKTTLVEYVASKTGRKLGENFIKVQLGDQTDSKMLLGTYRCTDVPGEFIWQPGVLTQAVVEGYWLLLEDIDLASMDIASVLSSLLENGSLTIPGYRDSVSITPGFQLFVSQRLISTITGHHKRHSNAMSLLEKQLLQINIDPLTAAELEQIIITLYPQFPKNFATRLISVFHIFTQTDEITIPKTSRLISTRDFFKWCSRASIDFDVKSQASALKVLQDAIDIFCCSLPKLEEAVLLAKEISTHLGIINQKAAYFFTQYKPSIRLTYNCLEVNRGKISRNDVSTLKHSYFFTRPSAVLLERIMCCVNLNEPVLLVGETGTGKTSCVQYLANATGQKLVVINMNQQSDSADLLGGFKPVDLKFIVGPLRLEFEEVFCNYFKVETNRTFLGHISTCFNLQRYSDMVKLMTRSYEAAVARLRKPGAPKKEMLPQWEKIGEKLHKLQVQMKQGNALAFSFIEGSLVKAVEAGHWVLLDEINLANAETLECLSGLLEGANGSLCLLERGDKKPIRRHANFTLFACMNPSTDVGKKDLPAGLRNRFTEFYVDELTEKNDLVLLVGSYLESLSLKDQDLEKIVSFYLKVRKETETSLSDGLGHRPHFSLRSLCRALMITARNPCGMIKKSLYEAFCLSFLTQLDSKSYSLVEKMIAKYIVGDEKLLKSVLKQPIPVPKSNPKDFIQFEGYWVKKGDLECVTPDDYVLTESVRKNLKDLVRIVSIGGLPVLLQGDTSVGKTSLITYLARSSGNKCVRINNHEHTDLQEYIGSYMADSEGRLVFREGLLVQAMRQGHWIILDELNLAPTDVLEALNRVLDDNRELYIPETQETVKAHANFMLFATQNPPGSYGGRKMLSRAFRNRFVELHFNEIPPKELEFILHQRCQMAPSYAKKMISVMTELQMRRRGSAAFAGKKGFITLRDLFRWGERYRLAGDKQGLYDWDQHLADEGYLVLAGRVRKKEERAEIVEVLQKHLKRGVDPQKLFTLSEKTSAVTKEILVKIYENRHKYANIVWTFNMRQLAVLIAKAFQFKEPVLLVGETGGGKTTVCQLIADLNGQELLSVNCHMHTESSDFLGGLRPVRDHTDSDVTKLFEWVDGPLIHAMHQGSIFLADEISLADDSVLERLNSLLEPERALLLAEKGVNNTSELVIAHPNFYFIGTMNPGGDFGKKELSPALRNRFTEIWCESCTDRQDLISIIEQNLKEGIEFGRGKNEIGTCVMDFVEWFKGTEIGKRCTVSIRDILTWVNFINTCADKIGVFEAYTHGVYLIFLDSLGTGITATESSASLRKFCTMCETFIKNQLKSYEFSYNSINDEMCVDSSMKTFGIKPFYIDVGVEESETDLFTFEAPTVRQNAMRLLRGMQLNKAILLEGSPGVGKTSLVTALAKITKHKIFRVNLSDQTDISDLFGADLPTEGGTGGQFSWRDGPLLQALKQGHWILLDELNLASQSVLEGLNACLDHRGEIFIPELGKTFYVKQGTRFFACQNPLKQGGSRRGLPQSFLNRFIQVYITSLSSDDLATILKNHFPHLDSTLLDKMISFNCCIHQELDSHSFGNKGGPWEFNLRDLTRWCEAVLFHFESNLCTDKNYQPESLVHLIYGDRMRTLSDKRRINSIFEQVFGRPISGNAPVFYVNDEQVFIGDVSLNRNRNNVEWETIKQGFLILRSQLHVLRSLAYCVQLNWMSLLVGSSGSGKSTVVKVLASLLGKKLRCLPVTSAMDTTDILGGFEQTNYSRHLEEIVKETEQLVLQTVRNQLVKGHDCTKLLLLWKGYTDLDSAPLSCTMEEETQLFLRKLDKLEKIWSMLDETEKKSLHVLRTKAEKMRTCVKNEGSLNAGGKFEWVDSVLIKCLQDGSWLLIDNVNLCSAAVLDRLNALLEPKGVLTVSERGVDAQGRMIEIVPHPDFRLFLTMDPKNGEISRAMRNRGVEIYMLNEKENETRNNLDMKSLINREGLKNTNHIDSLLHLHDFTSDLILGEKPNITELLRASALIIQQIQHGVKPKSAFYNTIMEVYCKTRPTMEFACDDFGAVIQDEIDKVLSDENGQFCADLTIRTDNLHIASDLQKIKQQAAVCSAVKYFLINFFGIGSVKDLQIRFQYISSLLKDDLIRELCKFVQNFSVAFKDFPIDGGWIPQTNYLGKSRLTSNRLILGLHLVASFEKEKREEKNSEQMSLRQCMTLGKKDDFDEVLIDEFLNLIAEYDSFLLDVLKGKCDLNDEEVVQILELITWRFVFYQATSVSVKNLDFHQRFLVVSNLKVHYHWFLKYALQKVCVFLRENVPVALKQITDKINKSLERQFSALHKFGRSFQKHNFMPLPRTSLQEIAFETDFQKVLKSCDTASCRNTLINLKLGSDFNEKQLEPLLEQPNRVVEETDLGLVIEHLAALKLRKSLGERRISEEITSFPIPVDLSCALLLYNRDKDPRLVHTLTKTFFSYLSRSSFAPVLTHHLTSLLVNGGPTKFGNFRAVMKLHQQLSLTLWRNFQQLQDFDYLSNERRFVSDSFQSFLRTLAGTLNITSDSFSGLVEVCLKRLSLLRNTNDLSNSFLRHLESGALHYSQLENCTDFHNGLRLVYFMHMEVSYAKAVLNSRLLLIDPSTKKALKKKYCAENIASFQDLRDSFANANEVYSGNEQSLHPHYKLVLEMLKTLQRKNEQLGSYAAVRPKVFYEEVVKAVNHAFATILSPERVDRLIRDLDNSIKDLIRETSFSAEDCNRIFKQYESAASSFTNLFAELSKFSPSYPDVIEPLLSNLSEFLYGFKSSLLLLRKLAMRLEYKKFGDVQQELVGLVAVPTLGHCCIIDDAEPQKLVKFVDHLLADKRENLRLLKCEMQQSFNKCVIGANGDLLDFSHFGNFLKAFVSLWNEQEEQRELQEKEADSLYKTRTKCADKTETEQIEDELKELFPNYHDQDFSDMHGKNECADNSTKSETLDLVGVISDVDIKFVIDLHLALVQNFTKTEWLKPAKNNKSVVDFVTPLLEKFQVFKRVCEKVLPCLDYRMDKELIGSISVLLNFTQSCGDKNSLVEHSSSTLQRTDFYKDSNVDEVKASFHILEELRLKIKELLAEWPDHPTLNTIMVIIDRVYGFEITSPLSRFLTGFELLLSKCHEWEQVAHSGVSLTQFEQTIIQQIIAWRKMELSVWKDLLNNTFSRMNSASTSKWWLYLYNIMEQFTSEEKYTDIELIQALQNYVSKSNLAEFQSRLNLLHAFHCHAVHLKRTERSRAFVCILWNVYCYFGQFDQTIANKIKELRTPIEKKLKDYVKIVRWKDVNYWAVKETVDKTHKILHKYVREFQDVLNQPVSTYLVNTANSDSIANVGIWDRPQRSPVKTYHYTLDPSTYIAKEKKSSETCPLSVESYFSEARKLCRDAIPKMKYPKLIQTLENFVSEVIETSTHLQSLEVDTTLTKAKQKSLAKSILHQKHRALADLFKQLTKMGLSFRSGIIENKQKELGAEFLLKPIDLLANFSHINYNRKDEKILTIWDSCEMYYLRSLMRSDVLATALKIPAQDLGQQNIERCKGFTANLLALAQRQKAQLTESSNLFYYLRHYTTQMSKLCEAKELIHIDLVDRIQNTMRQIQIVVSQFKIILNSWPEESFSETCIIVLQPEPANFIQFKNDEIWSKCSNLLDSVRNTAEKISKDLAKAKGEVPHTEFDLVHLSYIPTSDVSFTVDKLDLISKDLTTLMDIFGKNSLTRSLSSLLSEIEDEKLALNQKTGTSSTNLDQLVSKLSGEISQALLKINQRYTQPDEDRDELEENHLKIGIVDNLQNDFTDLSVPKVLSLCHEIASEFFGQVSNDQKTLMSSILPLLEQFILCHQYFLTQQVSAYRIICKMNSILLNIFIELASKGFCVPPELAEEMEEGEGKASNGLGLGDGQGENDVSDRIESEDQLDDAQPGGQEKENNDEDCKEEDKGIEMSEDFEGKHQDVEQKDDEESNDEDDDDDDAEEQMGETENDANKQEKETFGSDEGSGDENEDKEEKGEGGERDGEQELGAKENQSNQDTLDKDAEREKEEKSKEINEMQEPEYDDEQTDPYHGNQPELPEPEAIDLPDDLQLDDGQEDDKEGEGEENPFDVDAMKEDNPFEKEEKDEVENEQEKNDFSSDDEEIKQTENEEADEKDDEDAKKEQSQDKADEGEEPKETEENNESGMDQTQTNEDNVEAMEAENSESTDRTVPNQSKNQANQAIEELCQEDKPDKEGVGQSQMEESSTGHSAQTTSSQEMQSSKRQREEELKKQQKPGDSDAQRSLGDVNEPVKKKLKTVDSQDNDEEGGEENGDEAEIYKHIKEAKETAQTQVLDVATKEQAESQKYMNDEEEEDEERAKAEEEPEEIEDVAEIQKREKTESKKSDNKKQHREGDVLDEVHDVEIEGETVETSSVPRGTDTTYHTLYEELKKISTERLTQEQISVLRTDVERQLSSWTEVPSDVEADQAWQKISSVMSSLAQDLSEQLRLVLEPTQTSRLKGDYRTGRRINMRKVIPYIASQFRKDKIWLRRTKPSKRDYQIVLAIDDSSSMADNHSKELAFESVALISKALSLLESGQLSVLSFGENTEILHKLSDQFTDQSGVKLLQKFKFRQNKTCVAKLVDFVAEMFAKSQMRSSALNAKLLVIVSDGRGVFSEGEGVVRQAVRRARLENIFMVFVIIDNPENKSSILDIRMPTFKDGKLLGIQNYMDVFPFSFYIILRDINALPNVLSDALRQWFEVVSNLDKQ